MKKINSVQDLLQNQMQNIFDAENQLIRTLPLFIKSASNNELQKVFSQHIQETKMHKERMIGMAHDFNIYLEGKTCGVMKKLIRKTREFCDLKMNENTKDAALIAYAKRIEHYEITSYEKIIHYSEILGYNNLTKIMQQNMAEESNTYKFLYNLSTENFNKQSRNYLVAYD